MKKRALSMLLIVCMLVSLMPTVMVSAAEGEPIEGLKDGFSKHFKIGTALSAVLTPLFSGAPWMM